ncbi:MAG: DUF6152 family protein [Gammaproteobacteria bacterium]|nr:DUF6152 family protein [Gammaproteobacteria bacterium]MDH3507061.1 DUF6152 family protein [Gammaproteobacteria bacterium]
MSDTPGKRKHFLLVAIAMVAGPTAAHHSPAAFDRGSIVDIRGEVTRYDWKNPHVYIFVEGTDGSGQQAEWLVEADPTPLMARSGWSASTLTPGDAVSLSMFPDRDAGKRHGLLRSLTTPGGVTLGMRTGSAETQVVANDLSGVWDGLPNFAPPIADQDFSPPRVYTQAALDARAAYTAAQYPHAACVASAIPILNQLPYLYEIEILDDRVLIRSEFYSVERTIYTDGRDHPVNGERTIQGHSIGRWEGTTLVVDTRLFADTRLAHGPGIPSGAQKHTMERFILSADGTELDVETFVEDPEFVAEPYTVSATWVYAPDRQMASFGCDEENARSFILE